MKNVILSYSGGKDSHVMLHQLENDLTVDRIILIYFKTGKISQSLSNYVEKIESKYEVVQFSYENYPHGITSALAHLNLSEWYFSFGECDNLSELGNISSVIYMCGFKGLYLPSIYPKPRLFSYLEELNAEVIIISGFLQKSSDAGYLDDTITLMLDNIGKIFTPSELLDFYNNNTNLFLNYQTLVVKSNILDNVTDEEVTALQTAILNEKSISSIYIFE